MAKIDKNANLYDRDGNLLKKSPISNSTIFEVENDLQKWTNLAKEHPENKQYRIYLDNTYRTLMELYRIHGNPHEHELIDKIKAYEDKYGEIKGEVTTEQIKNALNVISEELNKPKSDDIVMDEYVQFQEEPPVEEIKENEAE